MPLVKRLGIALHANEQYFNWGWGLHVYQALGMGDIEIFRVAKANTTIITITTVMKFSRM